VTSLPIAVSPSPVVLAFAFGLAVVTGAVFSAAPAWAMSRANPTDALGGVGRSASERSFVPRRSLVVVQVALSTVLLSGAGLLGRSLGNLEGQPLGFEPAHRTVVQIDPPPLAGDIERLSALYTNLDTSLRRIPGVASATWALYSPMEGRNWSGGISIDGREADPARPDNSSWNRVGPGYFETTGTRIVRGRGILPTDTPSRARVAVVNETFVRLFFERADAVGRRLGIGGPDHAADFEIVGVAEDVKYSNADQPVRPMIFLPMLQVAPYASPGDANTQGRSMLARTVVVETRPGVASIEGDLRRAFAEAAPDVTIISIRSLENQILGNFRIDRLMARLTSVYGLLAVALAALGLYGVTAYGVARRTREIGVRMALGADTTQVVGLVLRGPLFHTGIGLAIGVPLALLGGRAIASQLYGVGGQDPAVIGGAVLVLVVSAVVAAAAPARRASRLDPTHALRAE
jgi:predicted permease